MKSIHDRTEFHFTKETEDPSCRARTGTIHTPHGEIHTPCFVPVGTQASVKSLDTRDLTELQTQLFFVNTYHTYLRPGLSVIERLGNLHGFMNWQGPIITDSGGFQVFSLGSRRFAKKNDEGESPLLLSMNEDGVRFRSHWDGSEHSFTPESSMEYQWILGSDIHIAFDDCTPYPVSHDDAKKSMERTHRWAERSLTAHREQWKLAQHEGRPYQAFYGSIQGSVYEDLRKESAAFVSGLDTDGIAIGGVSVGESKKEMRDVLDCVMPILPDGKPRHLLGVGEVDDIFMLTERGVDTFDCVQPTRLARMGELYVHDGPGFSIDITKELYAKDSGPIDPKCGCRICRTVSRGYLHHLFRNRELSAYRIASIHNLAFMMSLTGEIRDAIRNGSFLELKKRWLYND